MNRFFTIFWMVFGLLAAEWAVGQEMVLVKEIPANEFNYNRTIYSSESKLFFTISPVQGSVQLDLWVTNGTEEGTLFLHKLPQNPQLDVYQGICYFSGFDEEQGKELWRSDGTENGTYRLTDFSAMPMAMVGFKDAMYFWTFTDDNEIMNMHSIEVGTNNIVLEEAIELTKPSNPSIAPVTDRHRVVIGETLYFAATDFRLRKKTERGIASETVADFESEPEGFIATDNFLYFMTDDEILWRLDVNTEEKVNLEIYNESNFSPWSEFTPYKDILLFSDHFSVGEELWVTDGTPTGTSLIRKYTEDNFLVNNPEYLTVFKDKVYLSVGDNYNAPDFSEVLGEGKELWVTDGTTEGTQIIIDIREGFRSSNPRRMITLGGLLYFIADYEQGKMGLYQSDGTAEGTILIDDSLSDIALNVQATIDQLLVIGGRLYLLITNSERNVELWASDVINDIEVPDYLTEIKVMPNPFAQEALLSFPKPLSTDVSLQLYNTVGQKLTVDYRQISEGLLLEKGELKAGMYFFEVMGENRRIGGGKLMVED